jgi:hypothetical protein
LIEHSNQHPGYTGGFIVGLASIPNLPHLIRQTLINQQGFDVDFGEHDLRMACP